VILSLVRSNDRAAIGFLNDPNRVNVAISRAKKLLVIVGDSKTVIGGAPELFGPLFEHAKADGLVVGVGAVVTACQRVGVRSQVQRLSRPRRGDRRRQNRRRRRGREQGLPVAETVPAEPNGGEPNGASAHDLEGGELAQLVVKAEPEAMVTDGEKPKRRRAAKAAVAEAVAPEASVATEPVPKPKRVRRKSVPDAEAEA
jgi:AAA domain-containing protein